MQRQWRILATRKTSRACPKEMYSSIQKFSNLTWTFTKKNVAGRISRFPLNPIYYVIVELKYTTAHHWVKSDRTTHPPALDWLKGCQQNDFAKLHPRFASGTDNKFYSHPKLKQKQGCCYYEIMVTRARTLPTQENLQIPHTILINILNYQNNLWSFEKKIITPKKSHARHNSIQAHELSRFSFPVTNPHTKPCVTAVLRGSARRGVHVLQYMSTSGMCSKSFTVNIKPKIIQEIKETENRPADKIYDFSADV